MPLLGQGKVLDLAGRRMGNCTHGARDSDRWATARSGVSYWLKERVASWLAASEPN
jgi:hypothetical protein